MIYKFTLPTRFANYLVKGDETDLSRNDLRALRALEIKPKSAIGQTPSGIFMWRHSATRFGVPADNCDEFYFRDRVAT